VSSARVSVMFLPISRGLWLFICPCNWTNLKGQFDKIEPSIAKLLHQQNCSTIGEEQFR
jgi:hypothetical protein